MSDFVGSEQMSHYISNTVGRFGIYLKRSWFQMIPIVITLIGCFRLNSFLS